MKHYKITLNYGTLINISFKNHVELIEYLEALKNKGIEIKSIETLTKFFNIKGYYDLHIYL